MRSRLSTIAERGPAPLSAAPLRRRGSRFLRNGLAAKGLLMVGLRGVGKTVLLNRLLLDAGGRGFECVLIEAPEDRSLPGALAGPLNSALVRMSRGAAAKELARRARRALAGFVGAMKLTFDDIAFSVDLEKEEGVADSGDLDTDLTVLLQVAGEAARARATALVLFVDEMQYVEQRQLAALIRALHRTAQLGLPVALVGSGLPRSGPRRHRLHRAAIRPVSQTGDATRPMNEYRQRLLDEGRLT